MSNELTIAQDMGMSLAEAMGISSGASTSSVYMPRMAILHNGIMGKMDVGGKTIKTEVIPAGAYKYNPDADTTIYSVNPEIRIFAVREQWMRWDNDNETMLKTVMATNLKGDLKDNNGGFNLGRPSGYIKDFKSLSEDMQNLMRSVKRNKVVFGLVTMVDAMDESGEPVEGYADPMPFAIDLKNTASIKALDHALGVLERNKVMPPQHTLILESEEHSIPTGATYQVPIYKAGANIGFQPGDNDTLRDFLDYIEYVNKSILAKWEEKNTDHGLSGEEVDMVHEFVNVEEAD